MFTPTKPLIPPKGKESRRVPNVMAQDRSKGDELSNGLGAVKESSNQIFYYEDVRVLTFNEWLRKEKKEFLHKSGTWELLNNSLKEDSIVTSEYTIRVED